MKNALGFGLAIAVVLGFANLQAADAAKGKELYTKKCQMCHAADGSGSAANQKKFGDKWKALGGPEVQGMKDDALLKAIKANTAHKMVTGSTTDAELADILAHVRTLKK
jgi:cytochrome c